MPPKKRKSNAAGRKGTKKKTQNAAAAISTPPTTTTLPNDLAQQVQAFCENLDWELHQNHLDSLAKHVQEEWHVFLDDDEEAYLASATNQEELVARIPHVTSLAWQRQEKAKRAFQILDAAGKGVIVWQDLQLVASEFFDADDAITDDDLQEMMREVDPSGDGILTLDDFYKLAIRINL